MLKSFFSNTVYIKVYPNKFELKSIETGKSLSLTSPEAFTTRRLLVGQFSVADDVLSKGIRQLLAGRLLVRKPVVVIHPMSMMDDGLSEIEERVFYELASSAGARKVKVWLGHDLSDKEVLEYSKVD